MRCDEWHWPGVIRPMRLGENSFTLSSLRPTSIPRSSCSRATAPPIVSASTADEKSATANVLLHSPAYAAIWSAGPEPRSRDVERHEKRPKGEERFRESSDDDDDGERQRRQHDHEDEHRGGKRHSRNGRYTLAVVKDDDWRREWDDVQKHRYDDYWMRGRIHPFFRKAAAYTSRSFGVEVVVVGIAALIAGVVIRSIPLLLIAAIFIPIGIANIRAARRHRP